MEKLTEQSFRYFAPQMKNISLAKSTFRDQNAKSFVWLLNITILSKNVMLRNPAVKMKFLSTLELGARLLTFNNFFGQIEPMRSVCLMRKVVSVVWLEKNNKLIQNVFPPFHFFGDN